MTEARRVALALGAFVVTWFAATLIGTWLFGSSNVLSWMIAAIIGIGVYTYIPRLRGHA